MDFNGDDAFKSLIESIKFWYYYSNYKKLSQKSAF